MSGQEFSQLESPIALISFGVPFAAAAPSTAVHNKRTIELTSSEAVGANFFRGKLETIGQRTASQSAERFLTVSFASQQVAFGPTFQI